MSIVNVKDFKFTYPGVEESVLDGVSFDIKSGEVLGIIGSVGAGKTTLCMAIAGFVPRITGGEAAGKLNVTDQDSQESSRDRQDDEKNRQVAMVFEDYAGQLTQLKVMDEVRIPLLNRGFLEQDAEDRTCELLDKVGINVEELKDKRVWELSGGQQQRLAIAATLALDPQILIFDNAIARLDPRGQGKVLDMIKDLAGDKTLVIVEQDTKILRNIADRILVIVDGNVIREGKTEDILRDYDLLSQADVTPPLSLSIARAAGFREAPLTPEEFEQAIGHNQKKDNHPLSPRDYSSRSIVEFRELRHRSTERHVKSSLTNQNHFGEPVIRFENVTFCYSGNTKALENINLEVHEGEVHAIFGSTGAGKTTLLFHTVGLLEPSEGKVSISGVDTRNKRTSELSTMVGIAFQNPIAQLSEQTVRDEIGFPLKQRQHERVDLFTRRKRYNDDYIEDRVSHVCELVGIDEKLLDRDPLLLPPGLSGLVTIAEALVVDPKAISLDEPTFGLGETSRQKLKETLKRLRNLGKAVLASDDEVDFVAEVADTVTILDRGRIVLQGPVHEVFAEDNWDRLREIYLQPPQVSRLAQRIGVKALTFDELVSKLSSKRKEA